MFLVVKVWLVVEQNCLDDNCLMVWLLDGWLPTSCMWPSNNFA